MAPGLGQQIIPTSVGSIYGRLNKLFYILLLLPLGCNQQNNSYTFQSIDYSYYCGYYYSIKIYDNGDVIINNPNENGNSSYMSTLNALQLDSLALLVNKLEVNKGDTVVISEESIRGETFCLIINYDSSKVLISYAGDFYLNSELNTIYNLAVYLSDLKHKIYIMKDTVYTFESRSKLILPPPPMSHVYDDH